MDKRHQLTDTRSSVRMKRNKCKEPHTSNYHGQLIETKDNEQVIKAARGKKRLKNFKGQQIKSKIIKWCLSHECKFSSTFENHSMYFTTIKNKGYKSCKKNLIKFSRHIKILSKLKVKGNLLTWKRASKKILKLNIIYNSKILNTFLLK